MQKNFTQALYSITLLFITLAWSATTHAQSTISTDSLLQEAQQLAAQKNYAGARQQARKVLKLAPQYTDASLLIGRTYAWEKAYDSARAVLQPLLFTSASQDQVLLVLSSVELWAENPATSLQYAEQGLALAPLSTDLTIAKANALRGLRKYKEAKAFLMAAVENLPTDPRLLEVQQQIKELSLTNRLSIDYQLSTFDQDILNWQLGTIQYTRNTPIGAFSGKLNYADRFGQDGLQGELEAWPRFNEKTYAYLNIGASNSKIFPDYRAGAELYRLLPYQMEASLGLRSLKFTDETVWLYTGHIGKYFHKYWASFRPFIQYQHNDWQATGLLQLRRYFRHNDEFITLSLSKGSTPFVQVALQEINRLDATRFGMEGQFRLGAQFLLGGILEYEHEVYAEKISRNRFTTGVSLQHKF